LTNEILAIIVILVMELITKSNIKNQIKKQTITNNYKSSYYDIGEGSSSESQSETPATSSFEEETIKSSIITLPMKRKRLIAIYNSFACLFVLPNMLQESAALDFN